MMTDKDWLKLELSSINEKRIEILKKAVRVKKGSARFFELKLESEALSVKADDLVRQIKAM